MTKDTGIEAIEDALVVCGLFEGYPLQRRALAGELTMRGLDAADVFTLEDWSKRAFSKAKRLAGLANVLEDAARCTEVLADVQRMLDRQTEVAERGHRKFTDSDDASPEAENWAESDRAVAVATRVDVDLIGRWRAVSGGDVSYLTEDEKVQQVADEFHIDVGLAAHLLAKGRVMLAERRQPMRKAAKDRKETPQQRLDNFRRFLKTGIKPQPQETE